MLKSGAFIRVQAPPPLSLYICLCRSFDLCLPPSRDEYYIYMCVILHISPPYFTLYQLQEFFILHVEIDVNIENY